MLKASELRKLISELETADNDKSKRDIVERLRASIEPKRKSEYGLPSSDLYLYEALKDKFSNGKTRITRKHFRRGQVGKREMIEAVSKTYGIQLDSQTLSWCSQPGLRAEDIAAAGIVARGSYKLSHHAITRSVERYKKRVEEFYKKEIRPGLKGLKAIERFAKKLERFARNWNSLDEKTKNKILKSLSSKKPRKK